MEKVKLAYLLEMTFTGAPSVYYGSEVGLGGDQGHNRAAMPWDLAEQDRDLYQFVRRLIQLRRQYEAFRSVDITWVEADAKKNILVFKKAAAGHVLYVLLNASSQTHCLILPPELAQHTLLDGLSGADIECGESVELAPFGCQLLLKLF
jgi:glycosidase